MLLSLNLTEPGLEASCALALLIVLIEFSHSVQLLNSVGEGTQVWVIFEIPTIRQTVEVVKQLKDREVDEGELVADHEGLLTEKI